ncbi:hypothetical protein [Nocardioides daphniae]|uniref:hypothetical protein n=1 Tax=Nocardioides daphniae TaxID=402297 RepID=UPI0019311672|nr:hypothetical protein [Nocardioides daphniae]
MKIAASTGTPTPLPPSSDSPSTTDSGTPSRRAPIAIAAPDPWRSDSDGCWSCERLRWAAPRRDNATLAST